MDIVYDEIDENKMYDHVYNDMRYDLKIKLWKNLEEKKANIYYRPVLLIYMKTIPKGLQLKFYIKYWYILMILC